MSRMIAGKNKFVVIDADTGKLIRAIKWADEEKGEYMQYYLQSPTITRANRKTPVLSAQHVTGARIKIIPAESGIKRWDFISSKIQEHGFITGAEIGVNRGRNMLHLLDVNKSINMIGIDSWAEGFEESKRHFTRRLRRSGYKHRCQIMHMPSAIAAPQIPDASLDFVFIDGDHSYEGCLEDIRLWSPKVKPGGMICGHDISWDPVKRAVDDSFAEYSVWEFDNVWWVMKPVEHTDEPATEDKQSDSA